MFANYRNLARRAQSAGDTEAEARYLRKCLELYAPGVCSADTLRDVQVRLTGLSEGETRSTAMTNQIEIVGIKVSNPKDHPSHQVWRLTFNGCILGDSRGYRQAEAIAEARRWVERYPQTYRLDPTIK